MGFYPRGKRGTMRGQAKFNPMASSITLFRAVRGMSKDKQSITEIVAYHNAQQRLELKEKYRYVYKKDLTQVLEAELSFSFGKIVTALMTEPDDYVLQCIHRAITPKSTSRKLVRRLSHLFSQGLGKDEYVLVDLLCVKSNQYLTELKKAYNEKYEENLEDKLSAEGNCLPMDFCAVISDMLSCERDETKDVDLELINEDVDDLMSSEHADLALQTIFQERSYPHIRRLGAEYRKKSGKASLQTMMDESAKMSGEQKAAYGVILSKIRNENVFYAERLRAAIDGVGRDDDALIRIVVLRSEIDLLDIMDAYKDKYGIDLSTNVGNETSGEYKSVLLKLLRVPDESERTLVKASDASIDADEMEQLNIDAEALKALLEDDCPVATIANDDDDDE